MARDQDLRHSRLVFYARDVQRLDGELDAFLEAATGLGKVKAKKAA